MLPFQRDFTTCCVQRGKRREGQRQYCLRRKGHGFFLKVRLVVHVPIYFRSFPFCETIKRF